jgi:hypothetical protein
MNRFMFYERSRVQVLQITPDYELYIEGDKLGQPTELRGHFQI